jgi:hypothetical protein
VNDKRDQTVFSSSLGLVALLLMVEKQDGCSMKKVSNGERTAIMARRQSLKFKAIFFSSTWEGQ